MYNSDAKRLKYCPRIFPDKLKQTPQNSHAVGWGSKARR